MMSVEDVSKLAQPVNGLSQHSARTAITTLTSVDSHDSYQPSNETAGLELTKPLHYGTKVETDTSDLDLVLPPLPEGFNSAGYSCLRYKILTVYRRLFSIIFVLNAVAFGIVLSRGQLLTDFVNAATANLMISGLARDPLIINAMFICLCSIPRCAPLPLRRLAAKGYHYGGVHSGCGVAAAVWYIGFTATATLNFLKSASHQVKTPQTLTLVYIILILLLAIIVGAYPKLRFRQHDTFEYTHRFAGWLVVIFFWALLIVFGNGAKTSEDVSLGQFLKALPAFWMAIIVTVAIVHPWLSLRKIHITPEYISPHAVRLHFDYTNIKVGQGISISNHPLKDWHSFAGFPDSSGKGFSCLVSKAGDWTADCVTRQPTRMWKRSVPTYGYGRAMMMFHRLIIVATGSGIGPIFSFLEHANRPPMRVLWQTRSPLKTYGQGILDLVMKLDSAAEVIDTDKTGRHDMLPRTWALVREFNAEAVVVVSNLQNTKRLVFELEARGVLAYGPLWDS